MRTTKGYRCQQNPHNKGARPHDDAEEKPCTRLVRTSRKHIQNYLFDVHFSKVPGKQVPQLSGKRRKRRAYEQRGYRLRKWCVACG